MSLGFELKKKLQGFSVDVGLRVDEELMVLFGPSGAGKTMILKMISGLVRPDEGVVEVSSARLFDSREGVDLPIRSRRIGYVFQDYALFPHKTVFGNISYGIDYLDDSEIKSRVGELVELMRLGGLEGRYPHELSGGQKQRTALARTLATSPRVLLLDEPFSALDYQVREKLRSDLLNIHKLYPITTVLVTHDLEEAFMLGKRISVINNGKIEQTGSREDVFYRPRTRNVARFMGVKNIFSGTVAGFDSAHTIIRSRELGDIKAHTPEGASYGVGKEVSFCIRPEEVIVIRPDKVLDNRVQDNLFEGEITETTGKGSTHTMYMRIGSGGALLKIELPNFVLRKLALATGKRIRVSLKKEDIWIIP